MQDQTNSQPIAKDQVEEEEEVAEVLPPRKLKPLTMVLWIILLLVVIGFAIFGVTTLQHHAPTPPNSTGAIYHTTVLAVTILVN
ncbi:hypothetical protein KDA_63140 [Dictyobacter alpinus]|uniref:Uncharacterized protein n=1 Tax=Dictyobacter alpinus TaxID=2014873 RepID=A0A402BHQ2_9CHLR|nr:hypothetical protein [Dictyobacter alpinus]GCE30830.1 hypothetical protein KDA_63140 [Dictyobacter alpinus]